MPRAVHDQYAKGWFKFLLANFGKVEIEREVSGPVRRIDLVFYPDPKHLESLQSLKLVGRMLSKPALIEFFRNPVPTDEIAKCRDKLLDLRSELKQFAKKNGQILYNRDLPFLWILSPTLSQTLKHRRRAEPKPEWGEGIYFLPEDDCTAIVMIHELPVTIDTIWLRLLGRGSVQAEAVKQLLALPKDYRHRLETLDHLAMLRVNLQIRHNRSRDLEEIMINLSPAYEEWRNQTLAEGQRIGVKDGISKVALRMLRKQMPLAEIAEMTDLTIAQLQALQSDQSF
ncbi:MAG: hypothetical protein HC860_24720 [Alkalinema sp. RU_4_3]|nr:hypothetical protein [Alkalinema sp. RU_4_3]